MTAFGGMSTSPRRPHNIEGDFRITPAAGNVPIQPLGWDRHFPYVPTESLPPWGSCNDLCQQVSPVMILGMSTSPRRPHNIEGDFRITPAAGNVPIQPLGWDRHFPYVPTESLPPWGSCNDLCQQVSPVMILGMSTSPRRPHNIDGDFRITPAAVNVSVQLIPLRC